MITTPLRTEAQREQDTKYKRIKEEYSELLSNPKNSRTAIISHLRDKYGYKSNKTIYLILKTNIEDE